MKLPLKVRLLLDQAKLPTRATDVALGYDLYAAEDGWIDSCGGVNSHALVRTGIAIELPDGYGGVIFDRSSMGKKGLSRHGGVIDNDYRGEVFVHLWNHLPNRYKFDVGDKIGQLILIQQIDLDIQQVLLLSETERGEKGYGSTGK